MKVIVQKTESPDIHIPSRFPALQPANRNPVHSGNEFRHTPEQDIVLQSFAAPMIKTFFHTLFPARYEAFPGLATE